MLRILSATLLLLSLTSCKETVFHEDVIVAGGVHVKADTLNYGRELYMEYCMPCHGAEGKGDGPASKGLTTPPRNFTLGIIKFGNTVAGELPTDEIIKRHLTKGLKGTAMLPWDLSDYQMHSLIQYIKTFAPKVWIGKDKKLGKVVNIGNDPYGIARQSAAIKKGKEVYHITANCQSCHQAYATKAELNEMSVKLTGDQMTDFDPDMYKVKLQDSEHNYRTLPPDFTWHDIRSASDIKELALRIAAGVGGTAMPAWKETITDSEIWAVAYYVQYLSTLKDSEKRKTLMKALQAQ